MTPTPGQIAYEAYEAVLHDTVLLEPWSRLLWLDRRAWETAAQAVLAAQDPRTGGIVSRDDATPGLRLAASMLRVDAALTPLLALATEAVPFLRAAFGAALRDITAHIRRDEGGELCIRVVVHVASADVPYLEGLLRLFDETWWLANCHRTGGQLVFDYETCVEETPC